MNEIYHDESLGVHINVVLVRMIMLGYAKVSFTIHHCLFVCCFEMENKKRQNMIERLRESVGEDCTVAERQKNAPPVFHFH